MDKALRDEFRAYRVETEDRIKRLEKAVQMLEGLVSVLLPAVDALSASAKAEAAKTTETKSAASSATKSA